MTDGVTVATVRRSILRTLYCRDSEPPCLGPGKVRPSNHVPLSLTSGLVTNLSRETAKDGLNQIISRIGGHRFDDCAEGSLDT